MSTKEMFEDSTKSTLSASVKRLFARRQPVDNEPTTFQKALAVHIVTTTRSAGRTYTSGN